MIVVESFVLAQICAGFFCSRENALRLVQQLTDVVIRVPLVRRAGVKAMVHSY